MSGSLPPEVSVLVPVLDLPDGSLGLDDTLRSLQEQACGPATIEVLVVVADGVPDRVLDRRLDRVVGGRGAAPHLRPRVLRGGGASSAELRTVGLSGARGTSWTLVEPGDVVGPGYVSGLLSAAARGVVPVAPGVLSAGACGSGPATRWPEALTTDVGKLAPVAPSRGFARDQRGEATTPPVLWARLCARYGARLEVLIGREAHLVRRRDTAPAAPPSLDQVVDVLAALDDLPAGSTPPGAVADAVRRTVAAPQRVELARGGRAHDALVAAVEERRLRRVPWGSLNGGAAQDLALLYCAPPWVDTAGTVGARRLRERGVVVDLVCKDLDDLRPRDPSLEVVSAPWLARTAALGGRSHFQAWWSVEDWSRRVFRQLDEWGTDHRSVYSRAMWVASHVAAAQYKLRNPAVRWTAEFSDPVSRLASGAPRKGLVERGLVLDELRAGLAGAGVRPPEHRSTFRWAELVTYALADEVLFTNEHQRDLMVQECPDPAVAERLRSVAVVRHHPVPPPHLYTWGAADYPLDPDRVHLGYFGAFYPTRGITEVTEALSLLTGPERSRLLLHVFTEDTAALGRAVAEAGLADVVQVNPYVGFLDYLALTRRFDVLVLKDYDSSGHGPGPNPYLPTKVADYAGSGTPVWALVEPGSVVSTLDFAHTSPLGDVEAARTVLSRLAAAAGA